MQLCTSCNDVASSSHRLGHASTAHGHCNAWRRCNVAVTSRRRHTLATHAAQDQQQAASHRDLEQLQAPLAAATLTPVQQQQDGGSDAGTSGRGITRLCPLCNSTGRMPCKECGGAGTLKRGGYQRRNPVDLTRIIDSKWTAMQTTLGWRHFRVIEQRKQGKTCFLLLQASCDHSAQLWVNAQNLKDRAVWAAGWLQMSEMSSTGTGQKCRSCAGLGVKACTDCEGTGQARLIVL